MARKVLFVLMLVMGLGLTYGLGRSDWLRRNGTPEPAARIEPEPAASSTPAAHESTRESDEATSTTTPGVIGLFAFQGGVRVSRSVQLGLPAYSRARMR